MQTINPIKHPVCFGRPLRIAPSAWIQHVPFGMFLMDILRPGIIVELGTHTGVSYCALCQAAKELRLDSRCYAIDTWEGDTHSGLYGPEVLADLREHHDPLYGSFSQLIQTTFDDALTYFGEGTIDLLHIDGYHTYEAVKHDFTMWLPKMSDRGVILFHDIELRERDLGVWRLWHELKQHYPSFELLHGHGLGLLAVGKIQSEPLRELLTSPESDMSAIRDFFYQIGQRLKEVQDAQMFSIESGDQQRTNTEQGPDLSAEMNERGRAVVPPTTELSENNQSVREQSTESRESRDELLSTGAVLVEKATATPVDEIGQTPGLRVTEKDQQVQKASFQRSGQESRFITSSFARWVLSRYGCIKYRYLLPLYRLLGLMPEPNPQNDCLTVCLDMRIPDKLVVGKGTAIYVAGWCYHPLHKIKKLRLVAGGVGHAMKAFDMGRRDILASHFPDLDPNGHSFRSGFWSILPFSVVDTVTQLEIHVEATLNNGEVVLEKIAAVTLEPEADRDKGLVFENLGDSKTEPLVAICMTSYNPPLDLFERQIQSIINQTHSRWVCAIADDCSRPEIYQEISRIVSKDRRFRLYPGHSRLGFYRNFERCLSLVPDEAEFVALSDHDDYWHSDKLQVLLSEFDENTTLVYSDMNIVDDKGNLISETYWTTRPNNYESFASLILANTVTGAASMFARRLINYLLPFPEKIGEAYHDHWIACAALATGRIRFVDRALYDYVQHSSNVLGHYTRDRDRFLTKLLGFLINIRHARENIRANLARWRAIYFCDLLRTELISHVLALRCNADLTSAKKRVLKRIGSLDESLIGFIWLWSRSLRNVGRVSETLGAENALLRAILWKKFWALKSWLKLGTFLPGHASGGSLKENSSLVRSQASVPAAQPTQFSDRIKVIQQKIAPLSLKIVSGGQRRINLLIPTVDFKYFFGGYIAKFNLARHLAESGYMVRIVIVDYCEYLPSVWKHQLQSFQGLERLLDFVELAYAFDRTSPLEVSEDDVFIATTWWTAHIAHNATKELHHERFLYLIQEYEPFTFPMGTFAALANQTYDFPHYGVFSTEFLRDYFRESRLGAYAQCEQKGERDSISFQNSITQVGQVRVNDIANRSPKKLLFYARPEAHAARNMFEMAMMALSEAIESGYFKDDWEFYGIGTVETSAKIRLSDGVYLHLLPRQTQDVYKDLLRSHDLGLSLMYTPHPSLVPIEMASAGMLVVTNTYANKTKNKLSAISENFIAVEPTIEEVKLGLREAAANIRDYHRRVRGSRVAWATDWDGALGGSVMAKITEFIEACRSK